jgi:hypothetical protein
LFWARIPIFLKISGLRRVIKAQLSNGRKGGQKKTRPKAGLHSLKQRMGSQRKSR